MITLKKISLYELPELIWLSYYGDNDLLEKYHVSPLSLKDAVKVTFNMIASASKIKRLEIYKVVYQKQPIGYVVTYDGDFLYSYAIAPKFRKKDILIDWWQQIKKMLDDDFGTMLYGNNHRAISFLKRQGMKIAAEDKENQILTFINTTTLCQ